MKITLESTTKLVAVNGVMCRVWDGRTERGVAVHAFVARIAVDESLDSDELERELQETSKPCPEFTNLNALRFNA